MRILLVKTSSLGDVVHALPVVSDIRRHRPNATIDWVVEETFADIPRLHPGVAAVIPVAVRRWRASLARVATWREMLAYRRAVRQPPQAEFGYDSVIDCQGLAKSAILTAQARGKKYGFAAPREGLAAFAYDYAVDVPWGQHAVIRNRQLAAGALDYTLAADEPLEYGIAATALRAPWLPRSPYAVLLTATSRADKMWPEEHWLAVGRALDAAGVACVLPAGTDEERARATQLAARLPQAVAAPPLQLAEIARLLAGARLAIGVDTGLIHLAAALGVPAAAIFCASDPRRTGLLARSPVINLGARGAPPTAQAVVAAAESLLAA